MDTAKKTRLLFWVTCPTCNHVKGVEPRVVMQYLERILRDRKEHVNSMKELLDSAQADLQPKKRAH